MTQCLMQRNSATSCTHEKGRKKEQTCACSHGARSREHNSRGKDSRRPHLYVNLPFPVAQRRCTDARLLLSSLLSRGSFIRGSPITGFNWSDHTERRDSRNLNEMLQAGCATRIKIGIGVPWCATGMVEIGDNCREQVANDESLSRWCHRVPAYYLARHSVSPRSLVARMIMRSPIMADEFAP